MLGRFGFGRLELKKGKRRMREVYCVALGAAVASVAWASAAAADAGGGDAAGTGITVAQAQQAAPKSGGGTVTLPELSVTGQATDVQDPANTDYAWPNATTGTKTDTPVMETPLNVQVVTQQVLQDQQVTRIDQALTNVSGVTVAGGSANGNGQPFASLFLRGFETDAHFRNGVRLDSFGDDSSTYGQQLANVESVEVLKGPAAILYGAVEPGGIVNIVTKQPLSSPYYSAEQQFGSFSFYRTSVDATGPLTEDGSLLYRLNMSYQDSGSFVDLGYQKSQFVAPVVKWNIDPSNQLTFEFEYRLLDLGQNYGFVPLFNGNPLTNNPSVNYGEHSPDIERTYLANVTFSHQFDADWSIKQSVLFSDTTLSSAGVYPLSLGPDFPGYPTPSGYAVSRFTNSESSQNHVYSLNTDLIGHVDTYGIKHTLLFGGDYVAFRQRSTLTDSTFFSFIDAFDPVHPGTPTYDLYSAPAPVYSQGVGIDTVGLYTQDQVTLPYDVHFLTGFRYQYLEQRADVGYGSLGSLSQRSSTKEDRVTPRVGLLWQPQNWLSLYGNYAENFGPSKPGAITTMGTLAPPSEAHQWEVGAKTELFDGKFSATLAYFDLTKTNIPEQDPINISEVDIIGKARSTGIELDVRGEILPGWNVIANYANTNARVTQSTSANPAIYVGSPLPEVPRDLAHLWTTYEFQSGEMRGLKIGAGATFNGSEPYLNLESTPTTQKIPGYATLDLMTAYSFDVGNTKLTAQLNATNILDKRYLTDGQLVIPGTENVIYGAPRSFLGSIKAQF
jgi:iron complex outermembrane recepter protein